MTGNTQRRQRSHAATAAWIRSRRHHFVIFNESATVLFAGTVFHRVGNIRGGIDHRREVRGPQDAT